MTYGWVSLVTQRLKHLPAMKETWVLCLGQEDPLEKEMATYSSILAWRIPCTEEPGGLQSMGSQRDTTERAEHACVPAGLTREWKKASSLSENFFFSHG